jgi:multidrug efflux pump subunit AcrB
MAVLVILLFLGDARAAFVTALSLPFTYLLTVMWLAGFELNMVTLTAVIIAVGMLVDDAIVVIENIEWRTQTLGEAGLTAAARGTSEVMLAVVSGTLSNAIVLLPIVFICGYVETVLRPLAVTLAIVLAASLEVSVTIIPLLTSWLLEPGAWDILGNEREWGEGWEWIFGTGSWLCR